MEAACTSETSADNYFKRQYIPEDNSEVHTRRRENLKSHKVVFFILPSLISFLTNSPFLLHTTIIMTRLVTAWFVQRNGATEINSNDIKRCDVRTIVTPFEISAEQSMTNPDVLGCLPSSRHPFRRQDKWWVQDCGKDVVLLLCFVFCLLKFSLLISF
jgi:hypothetical protein